MRGGAWIIVFAMLALIGAAAAWPAATMIHLALDTHRAGSGGAMHGGAWSVVSVGLGWALAAAGGAVLVGWLPGAALARASAHAHGGIGVLAGAMLVLPILLPPHVHFWLWWQMWGPDVAWFDWIRRLGLEVYARHATLWLGLVSWSWPIGAACIAAALRGASPSVRDHLRLDGAGVLRRLAFDARAAWRGLLCAVLIVALFTFNNTTSFDLAQVRTLGYELRAMDSTGASPGAIVRSAWPGYAAAIGCVAALAWMARRRGADENEARESVAGRGRSATRIIAMPFVMLTFLPIVVLLLWRGGELMGGASLRGFERPVINTAGFAILGGAGAVIIALGVGVAASSGPLVRQPASDGRQPSADRREPTTRARPRRPRLGWPGRVALGVTLLLFLAASIPATAAAVAFIQSFNRGWAQGIIYGTPVVMVLMLLSRFGFVGAIAGLWAASSEDADLRAMRRIDGADTWRGLWLAGRPRWIAAGAVTLFVTSALSIGEVEAVWRVQPPGYPTVAPILLNNMHYQRDDVVLLSIVVLLVVGGAAALVAGRVIGVGLRRAVPSWALLIVCAATTLGGCRADPAESKPIRPVFVFGEPGEILGQFNYPRAIAADQRRGVVYIIDRSGRVQRFGADGTPQKQWYMPEYDNGYPTGVTVAPDGRVFVADTHEYRVSIFDPEGNLLGAFGEYGSGPGQFTFLCDIAFGRDGRIYVAEFGGNDRIQVFDANGGFLFQFGSFGAGPGEFNRPQSMCFNADGTELWVADACNHRLQVFDPEGRFLRTVGKVGTGPGEFRYPYGVTVLSDGSLLVCEFGNSRLQVLDAAGASKALLGESGSGDGQLLAPWGAAEIHGRLFVLDSRNNRVQVIERPQG